MEKKKGGKNKNEKAEKPKKATEVKAATTEAPANPNKKRKWADIQRERVQAKALAAASALASSATQTEAANTKKEEKKEKKKEKEDSATPSSSAAATPEEASKSPAGGDEKNQKKKKKRKRKKQKKQPTKTGPDGEVIQKETKDEASLTYLKLWDTDRSQWKFRKLLQTHLLTIAYDESKVSREYWAMFVRYILAVQGKARQQTLEGAKRIVAEGVRVTENEEEAKLATTRRNRAKTLIKAMTSARPE